MLRVLLASFKPVLQQIRLLQIAKSCCGWYRVVLPLATKSVRFGRFPGPRQTCFAASDVTPVYGVVLSNQKSVFTQLTTT